MDEYAAAQPDPDAQSRLRSHRLFLQSARNGLSDLRRDFSKPVLLLMASFFVPSMPEKSAASVNAVGMPSALNAPFSSKSEAKENRGRKTLTFCRASALRMKRCANWPNRFAHTAV